MGGSSLVIPECQQTGCIPIAMKVGAVEELIEHAVDGILIPDVGEHGIIQEYCTWIDALIDSDKLRMELSEKAFARGTASNWDSNFQPLLEWLRGEFNLSPSSEDETDTPLVPKHSVDDTSSKNGEVRFV